MIINVKQRVIADTIFSVSEKRVFKIIKDISLCLSFAILTAILSKIKVEVGAIPVTMQTFAVFLSGALLGSRKGALSQLMYLIFGIFGAPFFARGGGFAYILSPTFGYIIGFSFAAFFIGFLFEKKLCNNIKTSIIGFSLCNILIYLPGLFWLTKFVGFEKVLTIGLCPFLLGDFLKILLASFILPVFFKINERFNLNKK